MASKQTMLIHVGAGKTGTSALQAFFAQNVHLLKEGGLDIPEIGANEKNGALAHHWLAAHRLSTPGEALELWRQIADLGYTKCLVSSEFFHSKISAGNGEAFFSQVRETLSTYDIRIIFYIRRHSQWLQSAYSQWVKGERESRTFREFVQFYPKNAPDQIMSFAKVFGPENLIVRPYEKSAFVGGDIFHDFMNVAGVEWDDRFTIPKGNANPRLSMIALEMKRRANGMQKRRFPSGYLKDLLSYSQQTDNDTGKIYHSHSIMSPELEAEIETAMEDKYRWIAREILKRQDGVLFSEGTANAGSGGSDLESADLTQLLIYQNIRLYEKLEEMSKRLDQVEKAQR